MLVFQSPHIFSDLDSSLIGIAPWRAITGVQPGNVVKIQAISYCFQVFYGGHPRFNYRRCPNLNLREISESQYKALVTLQKMINFELGIFNNERLKYAKRDYLLQTSRRWIQVRSLFCSSITLAKAETDCETDLMHSHHRCMNTSTVQFNQWTKLPFRVWMSHQPLLQKILLLL